MTTHRNRSARTTAPDLSAAPALPRHPDLPGQPDLSDHPDHPGHPRHPGQPGEPGRPVAELRDEVDPRFVVDWRVLEDVDDGQRFSTFWDVEPLYRGPEPRPDWVVTDRAAVDTELGVLKTGKEADVFLLDRAVPGEAGVVLAAKRYRSDDHRSFHRASTYTEGRRVRSSRDSRAMAKRTTHGRAVAAGQWALAEWDSLVRCWEAGVPVPYPVQVDGTELLLELVTGPEGDPAPRLAQTRPEPTLLVSYWEQLRDAMAALASMGVAHGDLSAYNLLAAGDRLVVIDLPQVVDVVANPTGQEFLLRDCRNVCAWFRGRGLKVDEDELFADLVTQAFGAGLT